jgi:hypothetical protein
VKGWVAQRRKKIGKEAGETGGGGGKSEYEEVMDRWIAHLDEIEAQNQKKKQKEAEKLARKSGTEVVREEMTRQICDRDSSRVRGGGSNVGELGATLASSDQEMYQKWEESDERKMRGMQDLFRDTFSQPGSGQAGGQVSRGESAGVGQEQAAAGGPSNAAIGQRLDRVEGDLQEVLQLLREGPGG